MISLVVSSVRQTMKRCMTTSAAHSFHHYEKNSFTAEKVDELKQRMELDENLADRARSLIFGQTSYLKLSPEEQKVADAYQEMILEEDGMIYSNTRLGLEEAEIEEMLIQRDKSRLSY